MLVELLLQALVGQVDAELLKAVLLEGLEAVDVQDADRALVAALLCAAKCADLAVDGSHKPIKEPRVQVLGQRVARGAGGRRVEPLHDGLPHRLNRA